MASKSLKWSDTKEIAYYLIDRYPQTNPARLSADRLIEMVLQIPQFKDKAEQANQQILEALAEKWAEERADMEEELGPLKPDDDESLDEDEYRDDRMIEDVVEDEESENISFEDYEKDEDDEEEDEFALT